MDLQLRLLHILLVAAAERLELAARVLVLRLVAGAQVLHPVLLALQ
jgi:hypothetical protein